MYSNFVVQNYRLPALPVAPRTCRRPCAYSLSAPRASRGPSLDLHCHEVSDLLRLCNPIFLACVCSRVLDGFTGCEGINPSDCISNLKLKHPYWLKRGIEDTDLSGHMPTRRPAAWSIIINSKIPEVECPDLHATADEVQRSVARLEVSDRFIQRSPPNIYGIVRPHSRLNASHVLLQTLCNQNIIVKSAKNK